MRYTPLRRVPDRPLRRISCLCRRIGRSPSRDWRCGIGGPQAPNSAVGRFAALCESARFGYHLRSSPTQPLRHATNENRRVTRKIPRILRDQRMCPTAQRCAWFPAWDPSVLFTPAGMNQFKDHFLGKVKARFHPRDDLPEVPCGRETSTTSAAPHSITRFLKCWETSASAITSKRTRSIGHGSF